MGPGFYISGNITSRNPIRAEACIRNGHYGCMRECLALLAEENETQVLSICGMAGSGKTRLARMIYNCIETRCRFERFAWVCVSDRGFRCQRTIWEDIVDQLLSVKMKETFGISEQYSDAKKKLYDLLQEKRCLVVLDDVLRSEKWDELKVAFPEEGSKSKILITARQSGIGSHAVFEPPRLADNESWETLERKEFSEKSVTNPRDSKRMTELGKDMLKHSAGLRLAVVTLVTELSESKLLEWKTNFENMRIDHLRQAQTGYPSSVLQDLDGSYNELPYKLKLCFLYLIHFPQDYDIRVEELCQMWIAEGFVTVSKRERDDLDAAYAYLTALENRLMVQVRKRSSVSGRIITCRVPGFMREFAVSKAKAANFLDILDSQKGVAEMSTSNVPRLAIHSKKYSAAGLRPYMEKGYAGIRSIMCYSTREDYVSYDHLIKPLLKRFPVLTVLRLENHRRGCVINIPTSIGKLVNLKLLSFRNSSVVSLPSSTSDLICLETLNLSTDFIIHLDNPSKALRVISKMHQLKHLYLPICHSHSTTVNKLRFSNLLKLQTLVNFSTTYCEVADLFDLRRSLLKLTINTSEESWERSFNLPSCKLRSLVLSGMLGRLDVKLILRGCSEIRKLVLRDFELCMLPGYDYFPPDLIKLQLKGTRLVVDPMPILAKLPNLQVLGLENAFTENVMVCYKGGFSKLRSLSITNMKNLKEWRVETGSFPKLCRLEINRCDGLMAYPNGLRSVTTLTEISIDLMHQDFIKSWKET